MIKPKGKTSPDSRRTDAAAPALCEITFVAAAAVAMQNPASMPSSKIFQTGRRVFAAPAAA